MQGLIVGLIVLAAALYTARILLPRRWLQRAGLAQTPRDENSGCSSCRK